MPSSGNIIEFSFGILDSAGENVDTGLCIIPWYSTESMESNVYEVYDLYTTSPVSLIGTTPNA